MSNYPDDFDTAAHNARYGATPFLGSEAEFRADLTRDGAFDDQPCEVPQHTPASVTHRDCPDCLSVAGKACTDWTKSAVTGGWRGTGFVIEGAHTGRVAAMVQS